MADARQTRPPFLVWDLSAFHLKFLPPPFARATQMMKVAPVFLEQDKLRHAVGLLSLDERA